MMDDIQLSAYLGVFLDEVDEQLQVLDEQLLRLERDGFENATIQSIFRAAHTLKGSSAAMGFENMKAITHAMESVFDLIRSARLEIGPELMSAVFEGVDGIRAMKQAIADGREEIDCADLIDRLGFLAAGGRSENPKEARTSAAGAKSRACGEDQVQDPGPDSAVAGIALRFNDYERSAIEQAFGQGYQAYAVFAKLETEALMKSVRALLIYNNLKELGEIVTSSPAIEEMENEDKFQGSLVFVLLTRDNQEAILHCMNQISQIETFRLQQITASNLSAFCEGRTLGSARSDVPEVPVLADGDQPARTKAPAGEMRKSGTTVRVDVERLEHLLNYVGELIIDNTRLHDVRNRLNEQFRDNPDIHLLNEISHHLSRVISELQDGMMKTRMMPIEQLFSRYPRIVRDVAQQAGKEIELLVEGKDTELDRTLIEEIGDPILHILRNAADHGIEPPDEREKLGKPRKGHILLKAAHQENRIVITIADDGRGIDPNRIKQSAVSKGLITEEEAEGMGDKELIFLVFHSGFSTAQSVTELSGRGVGMDIVKSHIEKLNGIVDIETSVGEGTIFTIKLPLTLAIIPTLLVKLGLRDFAVPLANVVEIVALEEADIKTIRQQEVCVIRGAVFPLVRLHDKLGIRRAAGTDAASARRRTFVVVAGIAERRVCLVVDELIGNREIVIKSLGPFVGNVPYVTGSTILGDGDVALILDVAAMIREEGSHSLDKLTAAAEAAQNRRKERQLVTFGIAREQYALDIGAVKEIVTVPEVSKVVAAPEHVLGVMNLRGTTLPLVDVRTCFRLPKQEPSKHSRVLIADIGGRLVGLLVDRVAEVLKVPVDSIEAVTGENGAGSAAWIGGLIKRRDRFVFLLRPELLLGNADEAFAYA
ncbi:chemotaxis protein CheW [Paenibacillus chartarius]|uniref:Chemotaxis protein CheA n=1 Tax=Paenibacillus chartarius TaxID=747481 RepID=A0ABV6DG33_9BACL